MTDAHEAPESDLADEVTLEPSTYFPGFSATVAKKDGNLICWCCFEPLGPRHTDMKMNEAIIRVCDNADCRRKVQAANSKRVNGGGKTTVTVPSILKGPNDELAADEVQRLNAAAKKITG